MKARFLLGALLGVALAVSPWANAQRLSVGPGKGVGVDGGTSATSVTGTGTIGAGVRLVKVASGWTTGTLTLPAISAVSSDSAICFDDAGQNVTGSATLTIAANSVDAINGGSTGGSVGPFTGSALGLCLRVSATHNWTVESGATIPASTAPSHQFATGVGINGLAYTQPAIGDISGLGTGVGTALGVNTGSAGAFQLNTVSRELPVGWIATANPNNATVFTAKAASTVTSIVGRVETATGSAATITVNKAASGTACSAGTALHSGSFNANGTAATNQTLTLTTTALSAGDSVCLQTTGTTAWTSGTGIGGLSVSITTP